MIDYKFKFGAKPATQDKDLIRSALRGENCSRLFISSRSALGRRKYIEAITIRNRSRLYYIAPRWADGPLIWTPYGSAGLADQIGAATQQTIAYLADGVRQGHFFLNRGDYCGRSDAAQICRKNHPPSLWRADNDPVTQPHRAFRRKDPDKS